MNEGAIELDFQEDDCEGDIIISGSSLYKQIFTRVMLSVALLLGFDPKVRDVGVQVPSPQRVKGQGMSVKGLGLLRATTES